MSPKQEIPGLQQAFTTLEQDTWTQKQAGGYRRIPRWGEYMVIKWKEK